jgi:SAM-dependent methyltransferase
MSGLNYFPQAFAPENEQQAREIILSSDPGGRKWVEETHATVDRIIEAFSYGGVSLRPGSVVLDYGCGIGRIAKELISRTGCTIVGTDISPGMLFHSFNYIRSENFVICPSRSLGVLLERGFRFDGCYSVWVLQHCLNPAADLDSIRSSLRENGLFFAMNMLDRYVPVLDPTGESRFHDDGLDVLEMIASRFQHVADTTCPSDSPKAYCKLYRRTP